jgi:hypothetical protein
MSYQRGSAPGSGEAQNSSAAFTTELTWTGNSVSFRGPGRVLPIHEASEPVHAPS